jgi:hypothetical protein
MGAETVRFYQEQPESDRAKQTFQQQIERLERLNEPESPAQALGNLALSYFIGGAITQGAVMPRTEAIAVEGIVATTEYADQFRRAA